MRGCEHQSHRDVLPTPAMPIIIIVVLPKPSLCSAGVTHFQPERLTQKLPWARDAAAVSATGSFNVDPDLIRTQWCCLSSTWRAPMGVLKSHHSKANQCCQLGACHTVIHRLQQREPGPRPFPITGLQPSSLGVMMGLQASSWPTHLQPGWR